MIDEERQAQALRTELDHELAAIRATAQARERLIRTTAARTRARRSTTRGPLRLRPVLALPLAGALVATVIAAAVVVPTLLQTNTQPGVPAGGGGPVPGISTSPTPSGPTATAAQSTQHPMPSAATRPTSAAASPVRATPSTLRLSVTPSSPELGQRVILTVLGVPAQHAGITVRWGDRTTDDTVPGRCTRTPRASEVGPLAHTYLRAGSYQVTVTLDRCGTPDSAGLTVHVNPSAAPVPSK